MATSTVSSSSFDDDEKPQESVSNSGTSQQKRCYMHVCSMEHEKLQDFTVTRWNTYRNCLQRWLVLIGECRRVAEQYKHCLDVEFYAIPDDAAFHPTCYRRFIDKSSMAKGERRIVRLVRELERAPITSEDDDITSTSWETLIPKKKLKPSSDLPDMCIICKKREKYINKAGRRQREPLSMAETATAGQLQKAAELKEDHSLLPHIKDTHCVALGVQYHKSCYQQYTRFLSAPDRIKKEKHEPLFDVSYRIFCERIIRQRLLVNQEVLRMGQLSKAFVDLVKSSEGLDASNYSQDLLKKRLTHDFPQLVFHTPNKRNICEMVYAESLATETLTDTLPVPSGADTTQSSEMSQTEGEADKSTEKHQTIPEDTRTLYTAALSIKQRLSETPGTSCPCPPTSEDLNITKAQSAVPLELYNLVSWIVGATEQATLDHHVNIADDLHLKVLPICQDIVHLASKGQRHQNPCV